MGISHEKSLTPEQKKNREMQKKLLDTQDALAASLEANDKMQQSLLNTQDIVAQLAEKGGL